MVSRESGELGGPGGSRRSTSHRPGVSRKGESSSFFLVLFFDASLPGLR